MPSFTRRAALKLLGLGTTAVGIGQATPALADDEPTPQTTPVGRWEKTHDRVWLGGEFWANPMEDWRIVDGAAECQTSGGNRNVHLVTHQITNPAGALAMSVRMKRLEVRRRDGGGGFRIGSRSDLNEHRSNCFAKNGIEAGMIGGRLRLGRTQLALAGGDEIDDVLLELTGRPNGERYTLALSARAPESGDLLGTVTNSVSPEAILGNVAIVSNFDAQLRKGAGARYRFRDWSVGGDALKRTPEQAFGPLLWSMYTLSDSRQDEGFVLKLSAFTGPLGEQDNHAVELFLRRDGQWTSAGTSTLDPDAWVATFRIANWDQEAATPYKLVYRESHRDGTATDAQWEGVIRANPSGRPLRLGALTCQNDYAFPYEPVAENLVKLDPDMLYFSGDQLYENHGGFGIIRDPAGPAILNYLRKFYQFGWAFREAMRNRPTVCLPDDHDVFQGNIWGEGGAKMKDLAGGASSKGGYREPARMVNVVHRTCVAHHPDYFDPTPCKQNISVYYGDMVYGDVSFAIIGDRQWKSGPERVDTGSGRADHVADPEFDCGQLDQPGLVLLGERQEAFLKHWAADWRGHRMKVLLSQTVFAGVATHHGGFNGYLKADLDSGGWPQTARNNAIRIIRESQALHICGDQHLATLSQYGLNRQRDSNWSFCTPAIAAGYPRWWRPDDVGMPHARRPRHGLPNTGEFTDGLGNLVYVYAVGNPEVASKRNRYERAHQKGSGFGLVTIDTQAKTYRLDAFRFLVDANDAQTSDQFPGWPVTIRQAENQGQNVIG